MDEIFYWSAKKLAEAIRAKELSSLEVVDAHLRRIAEVNPKLNAVVQLLADQARAESRQLDAALARGEIKGPLHGVPMTVKDSLCVKGVITTAGTVGRKHCIPEQDATAVARMRAAGAILLGKTNCAELCGSGDTDNQVYGRTNNPYDLTRSTGGSSGGEVAIIAVGGSPVGLGSDFGGSIRGPAHLCGIAGLNPTTGRVPRTGHIPPYGGAFDTARIGPMARFVEDLALALQIISGPDGLDPSVVPVPLGDYKTVDLQSLRVAFHTYNGVYPATPATVEVVRNAAQVLSDVGMAVVEDCPPGLAEMMEIADAFWRANREAEQCGMFREFRADKPIWPVDLHRHVGLWLQRAQEVQSDDFMTSTEFLAWTWKWDLCRGKMLGFLERYDMILCPVDPYPALPHGATMRDDFPPQGVTAYTRPYSMAGWPSVVVRAGSSTEGLPIGVQVVAGPWREDVALAVAEHIEMVLGGWQRPPL
jgi:amidase